MNETDRETPKLVQSCFKCEVCGASFKKEVTLKKHFNTKHDKQNWKVCQKVFKTSMEVLEHATEEYSKNIVARCQLRKKKN